MQKEKNLKKYKTDYTFPNWLKIKQGRVELSYSSHALSRFRERIGEGSFTVLPNWVIINKNNVTRVATCDDKNVCSCVVRIDYHYRGNYLFLAMNMEGMVYSLWVESIKKYNYGKENKRFGVKREAIPASRVQ